MSWSLSALLSNPEGFSDVGKNLEQLQAIDRTNAGNNQCIEERDQQIDTVQKVASVLLAHEIFQNAEKLTVVMSGHANKDHKQSVDGFANESVNIGVSIHTYKEA